MTAVSIGFLRGADYDKASSYTITTDAPAGANEMQVSYQLLDTNGVQLTTKDLILFLQAVIYGLERKKNFFFTSVTGTNFVGPQL